MTFYFNEAHYVQSAENLVYKLYSMEVDQDFSSLINLELIGGEDSGTWYMEKDLAAFTWEAVQQNILTEGTFEALEKAGFRSIQELPEQLAEVISNYYSNGKYREYLTGITEICTVLDWANDGCKICPLRNACKAVNNEDDEKRRTAVWERGMAEAYERYIAENMEG